MFRTLFFLRLECGQECVVALLLVKGRKNYHAIMLKEKRREEERHAEGNGDFKRSRGKQKLEEKQPITV